MKSLSRTVTRRQCSKLYLMGGFQQGRTSGKDMAKKILLFYELKKVTVDIQELWQWK